MAGITSSGFTKKTLPEIIQTMNDKHVARYGTAWSTDTNNPMYNSMLIFAEEAYDLWNGLQQTYDARFPKSAEDASLDNVCDMVDVQRISATKSTASIEFTGSVGTVVPVGTALKVSGTETRFFTKAAQTLLATQFSDINLSITSVVNSTVYSITVGGTVVSVTSSGSATANSILVQLLAALSVVTSCTCSMPTSTTLRINVTEINSVLPIVVGARIGINTVSDIITAEAEFEGVVKAPANTLNALLVPIIGITSVNNLAAAVEGRLEETDEELRIRRFDSVGIIGASTESAIIANVKNLEGVTAAFVIANRTFVTDVDGRPAKSFEVVAEGGDELTIAETIWRYHPAGIETIGDITRTITDDNSLTQTVKFSRPTNVYIKMEIDYTKYDEEAFAATGEQGIKDAALAYGNSLNIGVDVIPQRFFGNIFTNVQGLSSLAVRISSSTNEISWSAFTTSAITIGRKQNSVFDISRIVVNEV